MALIKFGGGVTDARGAMGGTVFSRGRGGNYMRQNRKPINPRTPTQTTRRANMAYLAKYWSDALTEQQRTDWRAYAAATGWTNKLGEAITINGNAAFARLNSFQLLIPSTIIADAPLAPGHAGGVTFSFLAESDNTTLIISEPTGAFDKDTDIHTLWFFCGYPSSPGRISIPKGFKYCGRIWGSSGTPLAFPYSLEAPYTMQIGQLITVKCMFQDENYRISGPHWSTVNAALGI